jgi:hypothetical protein
MISQQVNGFGFGKITSLTIAKAGVVKLRANQTDYANCTIQW